ncbi:MAG: D-alanine--poly(phosphoribitol) ligase, partial [Oscillibacter sp.]|nr:D-alanine--poly(phosphoribitol) ligase [Oscillibacter sp.]
MRHNVLNDLWRTAREKPDKLAFSDGVNGLTFGEVCRQSRAVGTFLHQRGICRRPVVVFMEKSPQEVAAFFGVVAGGCFYVPLDAEMPAGRIQLILDNVQTPLLICDSHTLETARSFRLDGAETVLYSDIAGLKPDDAALQVIYD